jgi:rhomboid family GlyGly-CTERM serine protease
MFNMSDRQLVRWYSLPRYTVALAIFCLAAHVYQPLSDWLAYDRSAIQAGETWRLLTGHLSHYSADHLLWDLLMFVVLGVMVEGRHRVSLITTVIASATAITVVLWFAHPEVTEYRGLSGIDSALFTNAAIHLYADGRRFRRPVVQLVAAGLVLGFVAKLVYEIVSGTTLFVDSTDFDSLTSVHAVGGFVGMVSAVAVQAACATQTVEVPRSVLFDRNRPSPLLERPWPTDM